MEIKQLLTFKMAAENLNFTQTAKMLNFAQSSVTAQIKTLEEELGTRLFERLGKRLVLTEEGRKFKLYADKMIALADEAATAVKSSEEQGGTIVIGAQESQCTYRLPPILRKFKSQFPHVKLVFQPAHSDQQTRERLLNGTLDIAFIMDVPRPDHAVTVEPLVKERMIMVCSHDHPLLRLTKVLPSDLEQETLLLTETGCSYRTLLEESFQKAGVYPSTKFEFVSIEAIKQCVIAGIGIALLPAMAVGKELKAGQLMELPWQWSEGDLYTQLAWHKDKWLTPPLLAFMECTREVFRAEHLAPSRHLDIRDEVF
ncbi:LysR family transcriptional regulator [Brevibacillus choshinensis]|uniref:LysR family transcriptional regulator n=1 Tax=Brevibacillus choshinensis TaxID=54911 RepID=A0ABX7FS94_BRECH|nr:LysR family transcriptional regulator [Brevibacillus choshinensis]QRG68469.1 LysR family transcriptional regulator [Brevibacillus choshinensis]